jgi:hypothetical protein
LRRHHSIPHLIQGIVEPLPWVPALGRELGRPAARDLGFQRDDPKVRESVGGWRGLPDLSKSRTEAIRNSIPVPRRLIGWCGIVAGSAM